MSKTMTVQEVADYLGVHADTIYTMVKQEQIPHFRMRRRIFFDSDSIDRWKLGNEYEHFTKLSQEINNIDEDISEWLQFGSYLKKKGYTLSNIETMIRNIINTLKV